MIKNLDNLRLDRNTLKLYSTTFTAYRLTLRDRQRPHLARFESCAIVYGIGGLGHDTTHGLVQLNHLIT